MTLIPYAGSEQKRKVTKPRAKPGSGVFKLSEQKCQCCGQSSKNLDIEAVIVAGAIPRREANLLREIFAENGRWVSLAKLLERLYSDDPQGGPDSAETTLYSHVSKLRKRLDALDAPFSILTARHLGYRFQAKAPEAP